MKKLIVTTLLAIMAPTSAMAWGAVEQAALAAIVGGFVIGRATAEPTPAPQVQYAPPVSYYPAPVYTPSQPHYYTRRIEVCREIPYYDNYGRIARIKRICNLR
jgi:hypothetical protein